MQKLKTKEFWISLFMCLLGVLGIALLVKYIVDWTGWGPVWETDPNAIYLSNDISARFSSCLFFTNITLFIFCVYTILNFISVLFDINKLKDFLRNPYVLLFIAINQFLVLLVFTLMAVIFGMDLSAEVWAIPGNRHNIAGSFFKHYVLTIVAIVFAFMQMPKKKVSFKKCLWFLAYPIIYAITVKICGNTCFVYEWYPYPFFGPKHLWYNLFHNFENYNATKAIFMVIGCILVIAGLYVLITYLFCLLYNKLAKSENNKIIIAGSAGIGKTYLAKKYSNVMDMESSVYKYDYSSIDHPDHEKLKGDKTRKMRPEFPQNYIKAIKKAAKKYDIVCIWLNPDLFELYKKNAIDFCVCYPSEKDFEDNYVQKFKERGNRKEWIDNCVIYDKELRKILKNSDVKQYELSYGQTLEDWLKEKGYTLKS